MEGDRSPVRGYSEEPDFHHTNQRPLHAQGPPSPQPPKQGVRLSDPEFNRRGSAQLRAYESAHTLGPRSKAPSSLYPRDARTNGATPLLQPDPKHPQIPGLLASIHVHIRLCLQNILRPPLLRIRPLPPPPKTCSKHASVDLSKEEMRALSNNTLSFLFTAYPPFSRVSPASLLPSFQFIEYSRVYISVVTSQPKPGLIPGKPGSIPDQTPKEQTCKQPNLENESPSPNPQKQSWHPNLSHRTHPTHRSKTRETPSVPLYGIKLDHPLTIALSQTPSAPPPTPSSPFSSSPKNCPPHPHSPP